MYNRDDSIQRKRQMLLARHGRVLLASAVLLVSSCSRTGDPSKTKGSPHTADASRAGASTVPPIDAARDPLSRLVAAATTVGKDADGTGLGGAVEVRLVKQYGATN
jgi:hypothetical protein